MHGLPELDASGRLRGFAGSATEITDLKRESREQDGLLEAAVHDLRAPLRNLAQLLGELEAGPARSSTLARARDLTARLDALLREWLEYASLLHDIGNHISYERHHRHSYYLIKNGDLRGFEPEETEVIALVARYHRRGTPKKSQDGFVDLSPGLRRTVRVLSAFLRLAETLDRSRHGVVGAITVRDRDQDIRIKVEARGDAELEVWASRRQLAVLEKELGKRVVLTKVDRDVPAGPAAKTARPARRTLDS